MFNKIADIFKIKKFKAEIESLATKVGNLTQENTKLSAMLTPEHEEIFSLKEQIEMLKQEQMSVQQTLNEIRNKINHEQNQLNQLNQQLIGVNEELMLESFGLYRPTYDFTHSDLYNDRLKKIREKQKQLIKDDRACSGNTNWTVSGSASKGKKMVKDMQKLLLRAFNGECDEIVEKVKYNNFDTSLKRITTSRDQIQKLGAMMGIAINTEYFNLKVEELRLALEYRQMKQQEKEDQKILKDQQREEAKLQKEIEAQRRKVEKEQDHYKNALIKIEAQLANASEAEKSELLIKKEEIENNINETNKALIDIDYRQANQKAGYVYVVSNLGAFGENIYKIGMTRRLDPTERIDELGNASVPFDFDIHAMIFTEDAPKLEAALHRAFDDKKLNWVNTRREFFNVTLDEIKQVIKANYDKTAEFTDTFEAEHYRITMKMKQQKKQDV